MRTKRKICKRGEQAGVALLLAIFVLLLIAVVGLAMMAASGTETSLTANYRSSTSAYYAALSGLEEGRGRLLPKNPNYLSCCMPPLGTNLPLGNVIYITNPLAADPVPADPTNFGNPAAYPDTEYAVEFPNFNPASNIQKPPSVASLGGAPNALYKWVRINALTEYAIQVDVTNNHNGNYNVMNKTQPIYFDGTNLTGTVTPYQALGVTALAALPDKSTKLLQYVVAPAQTNMQFYSAITMPSPGSVTDKANFDPPVSGAFSFKVQGADQMGTGKYSPCSSPQPPGPAFAVFNSTDVSSVQSGINLYPGDFTGTPVLANLSSNYAATTTWDDVVQLSSLVQNIKSDADYVLTGPVTQSNLPSDVSVSDAAFPSNPMTVVVNGDLTLSGYTGYGLLVVTGTLTYSGDSGWRGIVLVIGNGTIVETGSASGGQIDGAVVVANTTGGTLGAATWSVDHPGGDGVYYDSCWVSAAQKPNRYKVLSFREIPYP